MKRTRSWDSRLGGQMRAAGTKMAPDSKGPSQSPTVPAPADPGASVLPSYLSISCAASGLLTATFLILLVLGITGRTVFDLTVWVWVTLFLGAAGVFSTAILRIRDLRTHAG